MSDPYGYLGSDLYTDKDYVCQTKRPVNLVIIFKDTGP
jgi:hypothetical protein